MGFRSPGNGLGYPNNKKRFYGVRFPFPPHGGCLMSWPKKIVTWEEKGCFCVSVPFTWKLRKARKLCRKHEEKRVVAGGPAVRLLPDYLADVAEIETIQPSDPLYHTNPQASRTTFGCPRSCDFCGVGTIEGPF